MITGDNLLRKTAQRNGVNVHGILWILDEFVIAGCISSQKALKSLEKIIKAGGRLPYEECEKLRKKWVKITRQ
ncbi:hypothetical protein [Methanoplanus limicola]|uniref:hypothetical protein n=1 Tax=Methanoplanus limicola TaxID=2315 RepID=UPI0006940A47|nr:hypothetical protein [Methanoplanus limicola]